MEFKDVPGQAIRHRQAVEATVVVACSCGAPGVYKSHGSIRDGWPGCYVAPGDPRDGRLVGNVCPNCGAARSGGRDLGVIWHNGGL